MSNTNDKNIRLIVGAAACSVIAGGIVIHYINKFYKSKNIPEEEFDGGPKRMELKPPPDFHRYTLENSLREPSFLKELREHTLKNLVCQETMTKPVEAQFYRLLLNMVDAKNCVEIGAFTGYNTLSCALSIPDDGIIFALELNGGYLEHGRQFFEKAGVNHKIRIRLGFAIDSLDKLIEERRNHTIDFIHVDADFINYANYLERSMALLRVGGIVAVSNTIKGSKVADFSHEPHNSSNRVSAEIMHRFNQAVKVDNRFQLSFLDIGEGITLCRKI